jgi:hypothetical protein
MQIHPMNVSMKFYHYYQQSASITHNRANCKERDSPDDGLPLYRFDVPLPFFALTILRRYMGMSVALVTLVN